MLFSSQWGGGEVARPPPTVTTRAKAEQTSSPQKRRGMPLSRSGVGKEAYPHPISHMAGEYQTSTAQEGTAEATATSSPSSLWK